ncbi:PREDICTED: transcription factor Pur-alpha 1-like [Lupinus angustifolius]|uniref:transcription factor Pur-alpha 1-like n=1 Tax=Lupinus angustifolius TaxID=3871 RepID=UPI00092F7500|nr:PREDICTED: transcription factor Pur-alpha 1-like [Lupinus angustifolius]
MSVSRAATGVEASKLFLAGWLSDKCLLHWFLDKMCYGKTRRLGGGTSSSGGGGNDVELLCKTLQVEHKLLYFDLKENPHGRYLEISEKPSPTCSTVIVPSSNISWFVDLFKYYVNSDDQQLFSLELQLDTKIFYFDIGENRRGCFLKVSEASVSKNLSAITVPAGSSMVEGWASFRNIMAEINESSRLFILPNQVSFFCMQAFPPAMPDDVGAGFISGQPATSSEFSVDKSVDFLSQDEIGNLGVSKVIRVVQHRFLFDLRSNNGGHLLRISEVCFHYLFYHFPLF